MPKYGVAIAGQKGKGLFAIENISQGEKIACFGKSPFRDLVNHSCVPNAGLLADDPVDSGQFSVPCLIWDILDMLAEHILGFLACSCDAFCFVFFLAFKKVKNVQIIWIERVAQCLTMIVQVIAEKPIFAGDEIVMDYNVIINGTVFSQAGVKLVEQKLKIFETGVFHVLCGEPCESCRSPGR